MADKENSKCSASKRMIHYAANLSNSEEYGTEAYWNRERYRMGVIDTIEELATDTRRVINMLEAQPQHKDSHYFRLEGAKMLAKELGLDVVVIPEDVE